MSQGGALGHKIKVGLAGLGYWGPQHARNLSALPQSELAWACDLAQARLDHLSEMHPAVRTCCDYEQLLAADVDAVVIATPPATHHKMALQALRAGKHVLVEKPLATSVSEAEEIAGEGERQGRVVMVGHTFEYNPAVEAVGEIIASGELGEIYYVDSARVNLGIFQPDINVVWDLAPHDVSILRFILDMDPLKVSACGRACVQRRKGIHDVAYLTLVYPNDILADMRVSWLDPTKVRRYTIVGSRKMLVYDDIDPERKVVIYDKGVETPPYADTEEEFHLSYRNGEAKVYPVAWEEPLRRECEHFIECIREGKEPRTGAREGLKVVQVLEAAQRSLDHDAGWEEVHG